MKSLEQRRQELLSLIQQLQRELDNLRQLGYGQSCVNVHTGSNRHLCPSEPTGVYNDKG